MQLVSVNGFLWDYSSQQSSCSWFRFDEDGAVTEYLFIIKGIIS